MTETQATGCADRSSGWAARLDSAGGPAWASGLPTRSTRSPGSRCHVVRVCYGARRKGGNSGLSALLSARSATGRADGRPSDHSFFGSDTVYFSQAHRHKGHHSMSNRRPRLTGPATVLAITPDRVTCRRELEPAALAPARMCTDAASIAALGSRVSGAIARPSRPRRRHAIERLHRFVSQLLATLRAAPSPRPDARLTEGRGR